MTLRIFTKIWLNFDVNTKIKFYEFCIISVGTNDVLNARARASSLYIPLQNLMRKANLLFGCRVYFQSLIPIPNQPKFVAKSVYEFNDIAVKACRSERCYFVDVFDKFLECRNFSKFFVIKRNTIDIHPNRLGQSIMARAFIPIIRNYFDPHQRS